MKKISPSPKLYVPESMVYCSQQNFIPNSERQITSSQKQRHGAKPLPTYFKSSELYFMKSFIWSNPQHSLFNTQNLISFLDPKNKAASQYESANHIRDLIF